MPRETFPGCYCQCPCPCGESLLTHTSSEDPTTLAGSFGSVSCGVTDPFPWILEHTRFCLCAPRLESLFPPVLWKFCNQIRLAFTDCLGIPSNFCQIPSLRSLTWGLEPSQQLENFAIIVLQIVHHTPGGYGIWFYRDCPLLPFVLDSSLSLEVAYFFFMAGSSILLLMVV